MFLSRTGACGSQDGAELYPSMDASPVVSEIHNPCNSEGRLPINDSAGGGGLKDGHNGLEKTHFNWES